MAQIEKLGITATITATVTFSLTAGLGATTQLLLSAGMAAVWQNATFPWPLPSFTTLTAQVSPAPTGGLPNRVLCSVSGAGTTATAYDNTGAGVAQTGSWSLSFVADLVRSDGSIYWLPQWGSSWSSTFSLGPASGSPSGTIATGSYTSWLPYLRGQAQINAGTTGGGNIQVSMALSDGTNTWNLSAPYSTSRTWSTGSTSSQVGATPQVTLTPGTSGQGFATLLIENLPQRSVRLFGKVYHGNAPATTPVDLQITRRNLRAGSIGFTTTTTLNPGNNYSFAESQSGVTYSAGHYWSPGSVTSQSGQLTQVLINTYRGIGPQWLDREPGNATVLGNMCLQQWDAYSYALATSRNWASRYSPLHFQFGGPAGFDLRTHAFVRVRVRHKTAASQGVWIIVSDRNTYIGESYSPIRVWKHDRNGNALETSATANTWTDLDLDWLHPDDTYLPDGMGGYDLTVKDIELDTDGLPGELIYNGEDVYDASIDSGGKWLKAIPAGDLTGSLTNNFEFGEVTALAEGAKVWGISSLQNMILVDGRATFLSYSSWTATNLATGSWTALHSATHSLYPQFPTGGLTGAGGALDWGGDGMIYLGGGAWRLDWGLDGTTILKPQQRSINRLDEWPAGLWDIWSLAEPGAPAGFCLPCSFRGRGALVGVVFDTYTRREGASVEIAEPPVSGTGPGVSYGSGVSGTNAVFATGTPFGRKKTTSAHSLRFQPTGGGTPNKTYPHTNVIHRGVIVMPAPAASNSKPEVWSLISPLTGHFCRAWVSDTSGAKVLFVRTAGGIPGETALQSVVTIAPSTPGVVYASPTLGVRLRGELVIWYAKQSASGWIIVERVSDDEGDTWSDPVQVVPSGGYMADNPHPRIAVATGDGIGGILYYWFAKTGTSGGADIGKLKGLFVAPGDTFAVGSATYFKDDTGTDLVVAHGTTHMVQSHGGQCWWVLTCLIPGETDLSDWRCSDESGLTFTRIS